MVRDGALDGHHAGALVDIHVQRHERLRQHEQDPTPERVEDQADAEERVRGRGGPVVGGGDSHQEQLTRQVDPEADQRGRLQVPGVREERDEREEEQHRQQRPDHREEGQQRVRHSQALVDHHLPERGVDERDGAHDGRYGEREERPLGPDDEPQHAAVLLQGRPDADATRLLHPDHARGGLGRVAVEDPDLHRHDEEGIEIEDPHRQLEPQGGDQDGGNGREERGELRRDLDQRIHLRDLRTVDILDQEAVPRVLRDLPGPVDDGRDEEPPEVLRECPDEAGDRPGDDVEDGGGHPSSELVGDDPAEQPEDHLREHRDRGQQADLRVLDPQRQHEHRCVGQYQHHRQSPQGLGVDRCAAVAAEPEQGHDHGVLA